jgi:hypothetical protein
MRYYGLRVDYSESMEIKGETFLGLFFLWLVGGIHLGILIECGTWIYILDF